VGIPLHERLLQLRARMVRLGLARELGTSLRVATSAMRRARRMERGLSLYRFARPFLGSLPIVRRWAAERELPAPAAETFRTWWSRNRPASTPPPDAQAGSTGSAGRAAAPETSPEVGPRPLTRLRSTDAVRKDPVALFTRRLAELGPEGETEFRQYARGDEVRAFLAARLAGIDPRDILVAGEEPEKREYQAGITDAAALIADTAGVVLDLRRRDFATASLLVDTHYVIAHPSRLVPDLPAFFRLRAEKRLRGDWHDLQVIATGPSRTADIEKTLVIPAHGPRRLVVVLCEEPISVADLRPRT
jgi:hypothetical protein